MDTKLGRYISAAYRDNKKVQNEQLRGIVASVDALRIRVVKAQKLGTPGERFAAMKAAVTRFIEEQDGTVPLDQVGTGLLGDRELIQIAANYIQRRGKDLSVGAALLQISGKENAA